MDEINEYFEICDCCFELFSILDGEISLNMDNGRKPNNQLTFVCHSCKVLLVNSGYID